MGYRSCVQLTVAEPEQVIRNQAVLGIVPQWLIDFIVPDECDDKSTFIEIHDIKWYESYEEIQVAIAWMQTLDEENYHFSRLGEEYGDYESEGEYDDSIYVNHSFERY